MFPPMRPLGGRWPPPPGGAPRRPGTRAANTAAAHIAVFDLALAQLPAGARGPGLLVRADSGGATHAFLGHVASLGFCFSVGFDLTEPVRGAILAAAGEGGGA